MSNTNSFRAGAQPLALQSLSARGVTNPQQSGQNHPQQHRQNPRSVVNNPGMTVAAAHEIRTQLAQGLAVLKSTTRNSNPAVDWYAESPRSSLSSDGGVPYEKAMDDLLDELIQEQQEMDALQAPLQAAESPRSFFSSDGGVPYEKVMDDLLDALIQEQQEMDALQAPIQAEDTNMAPGPTAEPNSTGGTYIDPYGAGANAVLNVPEEHMAFARRALGNSGVNSLNDYPLSTSPRMTKWQITRIMNMHSARYGTDRINVSMEVGQGLSNPRVRTVKPDIFTAFSYDAPFQPRTAAARVEEGLPVSPRTIPTGGRMSSAETGRL